MYKYTGCQASRNHRIRTQSLSFAEKTYKYIYTTIKKEGIPCVTNIVLALYSIVYKIIYLLNIFWICLVLRIKSVLLIKMYNENKDKSSVILAD